ncbi:hypothetical protein ACLOJK_031266 [Asimina triloba]
MGAFVNAGFEADNGSSSVMIVNISGEMGSSPAKMGSSAKCVVPEKMGKMPEKMVERWVFAGSVWIRRVLAGSEVERRRQRVVLRFGLPDRGSVRRRQHNGRNDVVVLVVGAAIGWSLAND